MTLETLMFLRQLTNEVTLKAGQENFRGLYARITQAQDELDAAIVAVQQVATVNGSDHQPTTSTATK